MPTILLTSTLLFLKILKTTHIIIGSLKFLSNFAPDFNEACIQKGSKF